MPEKPPAPTGPIWLEFMDGNYGYWVPRTYPPLTSWACGHARRIDAGRSCFLPCPACTAERKRSRKYIAGHVALLLIQILLGCLWVAEAVQQCR